MPLEAGRRLGPYEILGQVGAGGMGEVYRARDHRLGRTVAVKILPLELAQDPSRLKRFDFEARAAASLNHPNILAVHDVGTTEDGISYVVTELLEGQTLRELLAARQLPSDRALGFACQIAEGLAAVHGRGIVHRDLKPDNIFITTDGRAKILDFGVSKRTEIVSPSSWPVPGTSTFEIVGTPGYMAPEQVRGEAIDSRTDVFAFGALLYEMVSGRRAFSGTTSHETFTAVESLSPPRLKSTPEQWLPPGMVGVIERCLEKDPNARFQSTTDLAFALRNLSQGDSGIASVPSEVGARRSTRWAWLLLAATVVLAAGAVAWSVFRDRSPSTPVTSFFIPPPEKLRFGDVSVVAVSPDGQSIVLGIVGETGRSLFLRSRATPDLKPIPGTEDSALPFWSPDGRYVGFFTSDGKLKKVRIPEGDIQVLADGLSPPPPPFLGASWNRNGVIVFGRLLEPIFKVSAAGGATSPVTTRDAKRDFELHSNPVFLPDGNRFLYFSPPLPPSLQSLQSSQQGKIFVASLDSALHRELFAADSKALYVEPGYLLFMRGSTLFAQAFDPERLTTRGEPVPVARDVVLHKPLGSAAFSASNTGVLAYMGSVGTSLTQLDWRDRTGRLAQSISFRDGGSIAPTLSPDGGRLAFLRFDDQSVSEIWTQDLARGALTRQTSSVAGPVLNKGVWSPDGRELAFASFRENKLSVYRKSVETTQEPQHLADGFLPSAWSPDGQFLIGDWSIDLAKQQSISDWAKQDIQTELAVLTVADGRIRPLWKTPAFETYATLSPDGRWLAYQSNESESWQVYLQAYPPSGRRWQVSTGGGAHPLWRADGKELYFVTEAGMVMKVPVRAASSTIELGKAEPVFDATVQFSTLSLWAGEPSPYAVTRDGSRFLLLASRDRRGVVTVVMNWPESVNLK